MRHIQAGKRWKPASASLGVGVVARAADVAVDAVGVGPVGLDRDGGEAVLGDQALGDLGAARGRTRACRATPRRSGRRRSPPRAGRRGRSRRPSRMQLVDDADVRGRRGRRACSSSRRSSSSPGDREVLEPFRRGAQRVGRDAGRRSRRRSGAARRRRAARRPARRRRSAPGRAARSALTAASIVEPVAMPSSTRITVRPRHVRRRAVAAVLALAPLELAELLRLDRLDPIRRDAERVDETPVDDADAAARDRAQGELLVAGDAELAHKEDVHRRSQRARDLDRHRHAAPRQAEDDHVVAPRDTSRAGRQRAGRRRPDPGSAAPAPAVSSHLTLRHGATIARRVGSRRSRRVMRAAVSHPRRRRDLDPDMAASLGCTAMPTIRVSDLDIDYRIDGDGDRDARARQRPRRHEGELGGAGAGVRGALPRRVLRQPRRRRHDRHRRPVHDRADGRRPARPRRCARASTASTCSARRWAG